jgi:hypothetical protein
MNGQPRRNEESFNEHPTDRIAAIIDTDAQLDTALRELEGAGVDLSSIHILSGPEGAQLLGQADDGHGLRARLRRMAQNAGYESTALHAQERALNDGRHILYVPVGDDEDVKKVADTLRTTDAYYLLHFKSWSITQLPARPAQ